PIPGSPPTSTTDPGTIPPPSTKSNSGRPVLHRATLLPATSESRTGGTLEGRPFPRSSFPTFRPTSSSTSVFHAPHASQRPPHFGCSAPQSVQRNTECGLPTAGLYGRLARRVVVEAGVFLPIWKVGLVERWKGDLSLVPAFRRSARPALLPAYSTPRTPHSVLPTSVAPRRSPCSGTPSAAYPRPASTGASRGV